MTDTERDLKYRVLDRQASLAPIREAFERIYTDVFLFFVGRFKYPRVPDYKVFRV